MPATPEGRAGNTDTMPKICVHLRLSTVRALLYILRDTLKLILTDYPQVNQKSDVKSTIHKSLNKIELSKKQSS